MLVAILLTGSIEGFDDIMFVKYLSLLFLSFVAFVMGLTKEPKEKEGAIN